MEERQHYQWQQQCSSPIDTREYDQQLCQQIADVTEQVKSLNEKFDKFLERCDPKSYEVAFRNLETQIDEVVDKEKVEREVEKIEEEKIEEDEVERLSEGEKDEKKEKVVVEKKEKIKKKRKWKKEKVEKKRKRGKKKRSHEKHLPHKKKNHRKGNKFKLAIFKKLEIKVPMIETWKQVLGVLNFMKKFSKKKKKKRISRKGSINSY